VEADGDLFYEMGEQSGVDCSGQVQSCTAHPSLIGVYQTIECVPSITNLDVTAIPSWMTIQVREHHPFFGEFTRCQGAMRKYEAATPLCIATPLGSLPDNIQSAQY
jgi:hypothetical protein